MKDSQNQSVEIMEQIQNKTKLNIQGYGLTLLKLFLFCLKNN